MKKSLTILGLLFVSCQSQTQIPVQQSRPVLRAQSSVQQAPASVRKFKAADKNKDMFLSINEIAIGSMSSVEASKIVQALDFDRNQKLSFSEYYVSSWGPGPNNNDITPPASFVKADKNQDMFLTLDEIAVGSVSPEDASKIINSLDIDRDQKMSLGEYLNSSWGPGPLFYLK